MISSLPPLLPSLLSPPCSCRYRRDELLAVGSTKMSLPANATEKDILAATNDELATAKDIIATTEDLATATDTLANCNDRGAGHRHR